MAFHHELRTRLANQLRGAIFQGEERDGLPSPLGEAAWTALSTFVDKVIKESTWLHFGDVMSEVYWQTSAIGRAWNTAKRPIYLNGKVDADFANEVVEAVLSRFESLPHRCVFEFRLPGILPHIEEDLQLGKNCRLVLTPGPAAKPDQKARIVNALLEVEDEGHTNAVLEVTVEGHLGPNWDSSAQRRAYSRLKQFYTLGIASGSLLLRDSWKEMPADRGLAKSVAVRNETTKDKRALALPVDVANLLRRVESLEVPPPKPGKTVLTWETGSLGRLFLQADELFKHDPNAYEVAHVSAAIEWAFEANLQANETFRFILTCIALEALLGSGKEEDYGVTAQLADRCAFLLGRGRQDRKAKREAFVALYKARSNLVHGTAVRLEPDDRKHLYFADSSLHALIRNELWQLTQSRK